ncbi:hypothetical protein MVES1_000158 [Malassezia vespertilionis]|uniref:Eukaryotic translation initiation factor 2A n=1 Tax=Malassezia vespertilionis TaxID=2020962 RepID=A0A2N1JHG2_9BASI|nr:uncharacterized protein MVES1_000158 [Malassezia vespertilionis]PKI85983.1 hypothetical protein MVES_000156 [Malassezia vespertilionis]WFD04834.1 hypothetical protein MVES1_000158 [Malassezia vespertilionis]
MADPCPLAWAFRAQKRLGLRAGLSDFPAVPGFDEEHSDARMLKYSRDGSMLGVALENSIHIYEVHADAVKLLHEIPVQKGIELSFSPKGTFLSTWERPVRSEEGGNVLYSKNLRVWDTKTGQLVAEFERRQLDGAFFQFTDAEEYCVRQVSTELQVYDPRNFAQGTIGRLRVDNIGAFQLGPSTNPSVAVFFPEKRGAPASVRLYAVKSMLGASLDAQVQPLAQKSFFKAEKVTFKWNATGTSLLVMTATDHDQTGKSYYGESNLYMLSARGDFDCRVELDKEGPIHDFEWNPSSREFVVIYGYMPAKAVIFSYRVNVIAELGTQPRNLIAFNPQGRLFCLAGFGNLAGTVDIWDRERLEDGKLFTLDASNSSVLEWSPCGQFLLTGTLSPRLRVENGVKIWHCTGVLVHVEMVDEMYQTCWRPQHETVPPFPKQIPSAPACSAAATALLAKKTATTKLAGTYRPPGARSSGASTSDYLHRNVEESAPKPLYHPPAAARGRRKVPGAAPAEPKAVQKPEMGAADVTASEAGTVEKKLRNLAKKLKAIEQLKERRNRGEAMEKTQLQKIEGEQEIRKELQELGG